MRFPFGEIPWKYFLLRDYRTNRAYSVPFRKRTLCSLGRCQYDTRDSNLSWPGSFLALPFTLQPSAPASFRISPFALSRKWHKTDIPWHAFKRKSSWKLFSISLTRFGSNEQAGTVAGVRRSENVATFLGRNLINGTPFVWCYSGRRPTLFSTPFQNMNRI